MGLQDIDKSNEFAETRSDQREHSPLPMWERDGKGGWIEVGSWNAAIRTAAKLIQPKPLKEGADELDRLAHRIGEIDAKGVLALIDNPKLAVKE